MPAALRTLPPLDVQAARLVELGVHERAGWTARELEDHARALAGPGPDGVAGAALLVIHQDVVPASALAPLLRYGGRAGFVVEDMTDVDAFGPVAQAPVPAGPVYAVRDPRRHDELLDRTPDEAMPVLVAAGRTPLTLTEGLHWLLQCPDVLERGKCFMTIGSRRRRADGSLDARTPALWISNGTGRDGRENRGAPKVGWCWAGNRHTWLGFASASGRHVKNL